MIYCNAHLTADAIAELKAGVGAHRLLISSQPSGNLGAGAVDPLLDQAEIAFGQPDAVQAMQLASLKWIQVTSAGYTRYDNAAFASAIRQRKGILTNSSSVFAEPCAEHALAFLLSAARQFGYLQPRQWPDRQMRTRSRLLVGQTALLVGYGAIAARLVELLAPLRMTLVGVRRTPRGNEAIPVRPMTELDALLPQADCVLCLLPSSSETRQFFNAARFASMKPGESFLTSAAATRSIKSLCGLPWIPHIFRRPGST